MDQGLLSVDEAAAELEGRAPTTSSTLAPAPTRIPPATTRPPAPSPTATPAHTPNPLDAEWIRRLETRIHELTNEERANASIDTLSHDSALADIARRHSEDMAANDYFEHVNPAGQSPKARGDQAGYPCINTVGSLAYRGIGENIYWWLGGTRDVDQLARNTVQGWMDSPGHRRNILWTPYSQEGIGVSVNLNAETVLVTQNFC